MRMEKYPNIIDLILDVQESIHSLKSDVKFILRALGKVDLNDEFNIEGQLKAAKILGYKTAKTIKKKIEKGDILKENIHYRITDEGFYFFSKGALLSVKGLI